jgi:hypothetical protein
MDMLEQLMKQAGGSVDLPGLAAKAGVEPGLAQMALSALLPKMADPEVNNAAAVDDVASSTGVSGSALAMLLPLVLQAVQGAGGGDSASKDGVMGQLLAGMNSPKAGGTSTLLGGLNTMLDRDGDGSAINDIIGMFGRK